MTINQQYAKFLEKFGSATAPFEVNQATFACVNHGYHSIPNDIISDVTPDEGIMLESTGMQRSATQVTSPTSPSVGFGG